MARPSRTLTGSTTWAAGVILLLVLVLLSGCARGQRARARERAREQAAASGAAPAAAAGASETIQVAGRQRTFVLHMPSSHNPAAAAPLVLAFHGARGTGHSMENMTGLDALSDKHGFIVVYPDGYNSQWADGRGVTKPELEGIDDVAFAKAIIEEMKRRATVDAGRIYSMGISNGGMFSNRLGCELSDQITAIAFVVGPMPKPVADRCQTGKAVSALGVFGTQDPFIPWQGGEVRGMIGDRGPILGVDATMRQWAARGGCQLGGQTRTLPTLVQDGTTVKETVFDRCRDNRQVVLYAIEGGGHRWPPSGPLSGPLGRSSRNLNASETIWAFFSSQPPR